ncbi:MAG: hypothetical protein ACLQNE_43510 [Thermoguttaceae bacterium]
MGTSETRNRSAGVEGVRRRFDRWRRTRRTRSRIPDTLWAAAARAAGRHGIHRTSKALRLDYYALKKRVEQQSATAHNKTEEAAAASFLELAPPAFASPCECNLELEDASGAKMRVHLKGIAMPDLAALSRSFWNPAP